MRKRGWGGRRWFGGGGGGGGASRLLEKLRDVRGLALRDVRELDDPDDLFPEDIAAGAARWEGNRPVAVCASRRDGLDLLGWARIVARRAGGERPLREVVIAAPFFSARTRAAAARAAEGGLAVHLLALPALADPAHEAFALESHPGAPRPSLFGGGGGLLARTLRVLEGAAAQSEIAGVRPAGSGHVVYARGELAARVVDHVDSVAVEIVWPERRELRVDEHGFARVAGDLSAWLLGLARDARLLESEAARRDALVERCAEDARAGVTARWLPSDASGADALEWVGVGIDGRPVAGAIRRSVALRDVPALVAAWHALDLDRELWTPGAIGFPRIAVSADFVAPEARVVLEDVAGPIGGEALPAAPPREPAFESAPEEPFDATRDEERVGEERGGEEARFERRGRRRGRRRRRGRGGEPRPFAAEGEGEGEGEPARVFEAHAGEEGEAPEAESEWREPEAQEAEPLEAEGEREVEGERPAEAGERGLEGDREGRRRGRRGRRRRGRRGGERGERGEVEPSERDAREERFAAGAEADVDVDAADAGLEAEAERELPEPGEVEPTEAEAELEAELEPAREAAPEPVETPPPRMRRQRAAIVVRDDPDSILAALVLARDRRTIVSFRVAPQEGLMDFFRGPANDIPDNVDVLVVGFNLQPRPREVLDTAELFRGRLQWFDHHDWAIEDLTRLRSVLGRDSILIAENAASPLVAITQVTERRSRFTDKLVDLSARRLSEGDMQKWGNRVIALIRRLAQSPGEHRAEVVPVLTGKPTDLPSAPDVYAPENEWIEANDPRIVHFGEYQLAVCRVPAHLDPGEVGRRVRMRTGARLSLAAREGDDVVMLSCNDEKRPLNVSGLLDAVGGAQPWVQPKTGGDRVGRARVDGLPEHPERMEALIGEIVRHRSVLYG